MKKIVSFLLLLLAVLGLSRCTIAEVETIDVIYPPGVTIDSIRIPGWDDPNKE